MWRLLQSSYRAGWWRCIGILMPFILLLHTLSGPYAHAAGGPNFSLQPVYYDPANPISASYFVFNGRPASQVRNSVRVINIGSAVGTVNLYPVDAFTADLSGTAFRPRSAPLHEVGAWTILSRSTLTLAPGQSAEVPFQVSIPAQVRPGQHVGGIVAENMTQQAATPGGLQIAVQQLTIVAVMVNLPGPQTEALTATSIRYDDASQFQRLLVSLHNTGNLLLQPSGSLKVFNLSGKLLQDLPLKLDTILPQDAIDYPAYILHRALPFGEYRADLSLTYGHDHALIYSTTFTVSPPPVAGGGLPDLVAAQTQQLSGQLSFWHYVGGALILLLLVGIASFWLFSRRREARKLKQRVWQKVSEESVTTLPRVPASQGSRHEKKL